MEILTVMGSSHNIPHQLSAKNLIYSDATGKRESLQQATRSPRSLRFRLGVCVNSPICQTLVDCFLPRGDGCATVANDRARRPDRPLAGSAEATLSRSRIRSERSRGSSLNVEQSRNDILPAQPPTWRFLFSPAWQVRHAPARLRPASARILPARLLSARCHLLRRE